jgi:hypothetical protein
MDENRKISVARVQAYGAVCLAWLILWAWVAFDTGLLEAMVFGVCTAFAVMAIGLPSLLSHIAAGRTKSRGTPEDLDEPEAEKIQTYTGPLSRRQATIQILTAPTAVALGFTVIAIIDVLVRHSA